MYSQYVKNGAVGKLGSSSVRHLLLRLFVRISSLFGVPEIQQRLDSQSEKLAELSESLMNLSRRSDAVITHLERRIIDLGSQTSSSHSELDIALRANTESLSARLNDLLAYVDNRVTSLNEALVHYVDAKNSMMADDVADSQSQVEQRVAAMKLAIDAIRRSTETSSAGHGSHSVPLAADPSDSVISDELYVALENTFRGNQDIVAQRQSSYLGILPTLITEDAPLLDLGCGRGEWLDVLANSGIPAIGIDSNAVAIAECVEKGHHAIQANLVEFLKTRNSGSVGSITMFQVLEHLPFPILLETLREARRVLVPGGVFIGEVPNAKNLRVAAGTFWIDPTHQRPLYPELLEFLAREVGFGRVEGMYVNDLSPSFDLSGTPDNVREVLVRLLEAVDTAGDYALVATA